MKTWVAALAAVLVVASPPAEAGIHLGLKGGYALALDSSRGGAAAYGIDVGWDVVRNVRVALSIIRYESGVTATADGLSSGRLAVIPFEIGLEFRLPIARSPLTAVAGFGGGYGLPTFAYDAAGALAWDAVGFTVAESVAGSVCAGVQAGLEYALGPTSSLLLDARYRLLRPSGTWSLADRKGGLSATGSLDGLNFDTLTLGLTLRIGL
jgi:hypothetical protein